MKELSKIPADLLILLWIYTGLDKLIRWEDSRNAFRNQTFPEELAEVLAYAVPLVPQNKMNQRNK